MVLSSHGQASDPQFKLLPGFRPGEGKHLGATILANYSKDGNPNVLQDYRGRGIHVWALGLTRDNNST